MASRTVSIILTAQVQNYLANVKAAEDATRQLDARTKTMTESLRAQQQQLVKHHEAMTRLGTGMVAAGVVAAAGLALAIKASTEFGAKMAQLQALSHANAATMHQLSDAAMTVGAAYGFSATQVADAQIELVKAGVSVEAQLGGALKGALTLAAAGQIDVAQATEITTVAMTQFGLKASAVPHLADLLAAGADKALGSVGDLGEALKNGGLQAHNMGLTIDDTVGTLSAFANAGILGAEAGTQLRSMFLRLQNPTAASKKTLDEYGISINDASGKFVGIAKFADELRTKLGGLTDAQRNQALATVFGSHAIVGATVLYQDGGKAADKAGTSIRGWISAVNDAGFASAQAAGKMNSLQGDLQKLGAAFQTDLIKAGSAASGPLRTVTQDVTGLLGAFGDMPPAISGVVGSGTLLIAGVGLIGGAFLLAAPKVWAFRKAMQEAEVTGKGLAGTFGKGSALLVGLMSVGSAIGAMGEQGTANTQQIEAMGVSIKRGWSGIDKTFEHVHDGIQDVHGLKAALDTLGPGLSEAGAAKAFDALTSLGGLNPFPTHFADTFKSNEQSLDAMGQQLAGLAQQSFPAAAESFAALVSKYKLGTGEQRTLLAQMPAYREELIKQAGAAHVSASDHNLLLIAQGKGAAGARVLTVAQAAAAAASREQAQTLAGLSGQATAATTNIDALQKTIEGFGSAQLDARAATRAMFQAIDAATAAAAANGRTLDVHTQKGRDNQAALDGIATAADAAASKTLKQTGDAAKAAAVMETGRAAYIKAAEAMGLSSDKAKALADQLGLIPGNVNVAVRLSGVDLAKQHLTDLQAKLAAMHGKTLTVKLAAEMDMTNSQIRIAQMAASGVDYFGNPVRRAGGGQIDGRGPKGVDSVPALLAPNEHVWTSDEVDAAGGHGNVYRIRAAARAGTLSGFAVGGAAGDAAARRLALAQGREDFISAQRRGGSDPLGYVDELRSMSRDDSFSARRRAAFDHAANAYESAIVKLAARSEKAAQKLDDLRQSSAQMHDSIRSAIVGGYTLSGAATQTRDVASGWVMRDGMRFQTTAQQTGPTAGSIAAYYKGGAADTKTFAFALAGLRKKGIAPALLAEIAGYGTAQGLPIAQALDSATPAEIKTINAGYAGIGKYAGGIGSMAANENYADQIAAADRNAAKITDQLKADGEKLRKLIASAFGLKGYAAGTDSASAGIRWVGEHGPELVGFRGGEKVLRAPDSARWIRGVGGSGGGSGQQITVRVESPASFDLVDAGGQLISTMRAVARDVAVREIHADALHDAVLMSGGAA